MRHPRIESLDEMSLPTLRLPNQLELALGQVGLRRYGSVRVPGGETRTRLDTF